MSSNKSTPLNIGDNVRLIKDISFWEGYGFEDSIVIQISETLIKIESQTKGHSMYVKPNEVSVIKKFNEAK